MTWALFDGLLRLVLLVLLAINAGLIVWYFRLVQRYIRLNSLLAEICMRAWGLRQVAPIWEPWREFNRRILENDK